MSRASDAVAGSSAPDAEAPPRARVHYHTFGCKANQYDTERMRQEIEARAGRTVDGREDADVIVVNTCTVTNQADADARRFIRRVRRENPVARVIVAGCSAALRRDEYARMPAVEGVVRGHDPVDVAAAVERTVSGVPKARGGALRERRAPESFAAPGLVQISLGASLDRVDSEPVGAELLRERRGGSRGWLKVQDGCDRKCAFCATRLARGASRSRPPDEVVREALVLAERHAELVVTGIHIGHYGRDLDPEWTLGRLVALLLERVPDARLRLGSVEATEVDDLLLDLLATADGALAPHLHMPLQSGSDAVLRGMRRWHTRAQYRARALEIAGRVSPLGLGADVITGFPGETDDDHARTRALVEELPFTYLHVFPYSPRSGTAAAERTDPVPQRVAGERARDLRSLAEEKGRSHRTRRVGTEACVIPEGDGSSGLSGDYLRVSLPDGAGAGDGAPVHGTLRGDADHLYIASPR